MMASTAIMDIGIDRGVFVRGTPLWLDAQRKKSHVIVSGLEDRLPSRHQRLLTSIPIAAMLDRAGLQAGVLPATFRQWMGFGGRQVQLVELNSKGGETGVLLDDGTRRTLVLSNLNPQLDALPPVDHLVLRATGLEHCGDGLETVLSGLLGEEKAGQRTVLRVETLEVGLSIIHLLEQMGVSVAAVGLLGRLLGRTKANRSAWQVAFSKDKLKAGDREILLDTGRGRFTSAKRVKVGYYGGYEKLADVLKITRATALTLHDVNHTMTLPPSLGESVSLTLHHPPEKSLSLGFEALGSLSL